MIPCESNDDTYTPNPSNLCTYEFQDKMSVSCFFISGTLSGKNCPCPQTIVWEGLARTCLIHAMRCSSIIEKSSKEGLSRDLPIFPGDQVQAGIACHTLGKSVKTRVRALWATSGPRVTRFWIGRPVKRNLGPLCAEIVSGNDPFATPYAIGNMRVYCDVYGDSHELCWS